MTTYTYDRYGRVESLKDARGEVQRFSHNQRNQILCYTNAMDEEILFNYTLTGKLASITDPAGRKIGLTDHFFIPRKPLSSPPLSAS